MFSRCLSIAVLAVASLHAGVLRVCADPNNLPFSDSNREGFENKVAELIARDLGAQLEYVWWAQRRSFVSNSLGAGACDLIVGLPSGFPSVLTTAPWYRSTYVLLSRDGAVRSLEDPALRRLRIGIHIVGEDYAPPARALARAGIVNNIAGYSLFGAYGEPHPAAKLVEAAARGDVDVAVVWGPLAGYFAAQQPVPLKMAAIPFEFDMSAAVRAGDVKLKAAIEGVLEKRRGEIRRILEDYRVPLCTSPSGPSQSLP